MIFRYIYQKKNVMVCKDRLYVRAKSKNYAEMMKREVKKSSWE
jgi:hypothetical protein